MTIKEIQDEIVEEFSIFDDWLDRYQYIIDLSKELPLIDDQYKQENYLIKPLNYTFCIKVNRSVADI